MIANASVTLNICADVYGHILSFIDHRDTPEYIHLISSVVFDADEAAAKDVFVYEHMQGNGMSLVNAHGANKAAMTAVNKIIAAEDDKTTYDRYGRHRDCTTDRVNCNGPWTKKMHIFAAAHLSNVPVAIVALHVHVINDLLNVVNSGLVDYADHVMKIISNNKKDAWSLLDVNMFFRAIQFASVSGDYEDAKVLLIDCLNLIGYDRLDISTVPKFPFTLDIFAGRIIHGIPVRHSKDISHDDMKAYMKGGADLVAGYIIPVVDAPETDVFVDTLITYCRTWNQVRSLQVITECL